MSLSTKERDRRYRGLRAEMERQNIDILLVYGNSGRQGPTSGNLTYVSNFVSFSGQQALVFPREGEPVLFVGVENQRIEALRKSWVGDVRCEALTPVPEQVCVYLNGLDAKGKRVGISSLSILPVAWHQRFLEKVSADEWVEVGSLVLEQRYVQSEEEIGCSRRAAELGDRVWERVKAFVREGVTELDIRAEMDNAILPEGGTENFNMMSLGGMEDGGEAPWGYVIPPANRKMKKGDALLLEISPRVEGYWNQIVRVLSLGPAASWLVEAHDLVREARDACLKELRPGRPLVGLVQAMDEVFQKNGRTVWPYGLVHLTGLDLTDYMITPKSQGELKPGMVVTVHPMFNMEANRQIFWGETYLVTDSGHELLNQSSDELACI